VATGTGKTSMIRAEFTIDIETWGDGADAYDPDAVMELVDALVSRGAQGAVTSAGGLAGGVGAIFSVDGRHRDPAAASGAVVRDGVRMFLDACRELHLPHRGIARVDLLTDAYLEREIDQEQEGYLGVTEVARELGVSRQRVSELRARPGFPAPIVELAAGPVWKASSLRRFLDSWERKPGRPRSKVS
jgi:hypothetical protein